MPRALAPATHSQEIKPQRIDRRQALVFALGPVLMGPVLLSACGGGSSAPGIAAQPADFAGVAGGNAKFSVTAANPSSATYQWMIYGRDIPGATQSELQLPSLSVDEHGSQYTVRVTDRENGSNVSLPAMLSVTQLPMTHLAGNFNEGGEPVDGKGTAARFASAGALAADAMGNVYVADGVVIRKLAADGTVTHFAGSGQTGKLDGYAKTAQFSELNALAWDRASGVLAVADGTSIRVVQPNGDVSTRLAQLESPPLQIAAAPDGTLYYAAGVRLSPAGFQKATAVYALARGATEPRLLAGALREEGSDDGSGSAARFNSIAGLAVDATGTLFAADADLIRRIRPDGTVDTPPTPVLRSRNSALKAMGMAMNAQGSIFTAAEYAVRRWKPNGQSTLVARPALMRDHLSSQHTRGMVIDSAGRLVISNRYWVGRFEPFGND